MSIYSDKLAHVQVIINCQYSVAIQQQVTGSERNKLKLDWIRFIQNKKKIVYERTKKIFNICTGIQIQPLSPFVVYCCKSNNTWDYDEHLFRQASTCTGSYQLPVFCCTIVHPWTYARLHFRRAIYWWRHCRVNMTQPMSCLVLWTNTSTQTNCVAI